MYVKRLIKRLILAIATCAVPSALAAQTSTVPTSPGQAAYGTIAEVVRILEADPNTDWTKVDLEALRQHLIDMDEVTMRAAVAPRNIAGGVELTVTGSGRTAEAIKRMAMNHISMLDDEPDYSASAREIANGAVITVMAKRPTDSRAVARIRGLGFAGLMAQGNHHAPHHLAIARGDAMAHHR